MEGSEASTRRVRCDAGAFVDALFGRALCRLASAARLVSAIPNNLADGPPPKRVSPFFQSTPLYLSPQSLQSHPVPHACPLRLVPPWLCPPRLSHSKSLQKNSTMLSVVLRPKIQPKFKLLQPA